MNNSHYARMIKTKALELGFSSCGIAKAEFLAEEAPRLERWLNLGMNGTMSYLNNWFDKRLDPRKLVDGAKSVICVLHNYYTDKEPTDPSTLMIARYARGKDYHWVTKKKLKLLLDFIHAEISDVNGRVFVDSAPIMEKAWAARAGLGWIGKNSLLLTRSSGSFHFIGTIITDLELEHDQPTNDFCAKCRRCLDGCPTGAIVEPQIVDARKCISYLTIEYRGALPTELRSKFQNQIFGCDICQDVCPWNRKAKPHSEPQFESSPQLLSVTRDDWEKLKTGDYRRLFKGTAVTRTGFRGLKRNINFLTMPNAGSTGNDDENP